MASFLRCLGKFSYNRSFCFLKKEWNLGQYNCAFVLLPIVLTESNGCYKQYRNSKTDQCYIEIDEDGISWRLPEASYKVKEKEVIAWQDMKKVIVSENGITIRYMSTYFTDTIPFAKICEEDRDALLAFLRKQLLERSIVFRRPAGCLKDGSVNLLFFPSNIFTCSRLPSLNLKGTFVIFSICNSFLQKKDRFLL